MKGFGTAGNSVGREPHTRLTRFLAKIAGLYSGDMTPKTELEYFLDKVSMGVGYRIDNPVLYDDPNAEWEEHELVDADTGPTGDFQWIYTTENIHLDRKPEIILDGWCYRMDSGRLIPFSEEAPWHDKEMTCTVGDCMKINFQSKPACGVFPKHVQVVYEQPIVRCADEFAMAVDAVVAGTYRPMYDRQKAAEDMGAPLEEVGSETLNP